MAIKTILVYLPSEKNAAAVLRFAVKIASEKNAHVIGLHLIPDLPVYGEFPAEVSQDVIDRLLKAGTDAAAAVKRAFDDALKANTVSYEWRCFTASYPLGADIIARQGHTADLIVCGKTYDDVPDTWRDFAETAIMRSGRPVLVVPDTSSSKEIGKNAVIAWNDTREAARAVFDSLDLIGEAKSVRAITFIAKENQRPAAETLGGNLIANLARHGVKATLEISVAGSGAASDAILSRLLDEGCDLLIMGAYSHSRFREMIFGGVSRDILRDTFVPTLVSH